MATSPQLKQYFEDPPLARTLFSSTQFAMMWLIVRVWLGYNWIEATLSHKIGNPAWVQTGAAIKGFWQHAIAVPPNGRPPLNTAGTETFWPGCSASTRRYGWGSW